MLDMLACVVSYFMQGVFQITLQDAVVEPVVRVEPRLADVQPQFSDELHREFNQLTNTVLARSVPLLTVDELCRMVELDTQI